MQKEILITGCSSGIGRDVAFALKKRGYRVFATARKEKDVKSLQEAGFESYLLDVTSKESVDRALDAILKATNNHLYALFNNAGYGQPGALEDVSVEALKEQFETNFFGLHYLTSKVLPIMRAQGYGRIINHSSVLGLISLRFRGAYNASKYALEGYSDTLRLELRGSSIYLSTINTGPVISNFRKNALDKFYEHIDYKKSLFFKEYQNQMLEAKSSTTAPFTQRSDVVISNIIHALEAKRAKPRYYNTKATYLLGFLKRILPTAWLDAILVKI